LKVLTGINCNLEVMSRFWKKLCCGLKGIQKRLKGQKSGNEAPLSNFIFKNN